MSGEEPGCPVTVWDGPYRMRCGLGALAGRCARHGPFATASTGADVEALAKALRDVGIERGYAGADVIRKHWAEQLLASDWLAAHDAATAERVRRETAEGIAAAIERRRLARRRRWLRSGRWSARDEAVWSQAMWDAQRIAREQAR